MTRRLSRQRVALAVCSMLAALTFANFKPVAEQQQYPPTPRMATEDSTIIQTKEIQLQNTTISPLHSHKPSPPTLYLCGFDLWNFYKGIFDDYELGGRLSKDSVAASTMEDVLLQVGLDGPCPVTQDTIQSAFKGKVLFVNTESRKGDAAEKQRFSPHFFKIGPSEDPTEERTLPVYFGSIFWYAATTTNEQRSIFWEDATKKQKRIANEEPPRRDAIVFLVSTCIDQRRQVASKLSELIPVHFGPKCPPFPSDDDGAGTIIEPIPKKDVTPRASYVDNHKLYSKYKYCLVMENRETPGYITEKIVLAFLGGCIPIYWGTREVFDVFHRDSFVYYDVEHPDEAMAQLQELQSNPEAYHAKRMSPMLARGNQTLEDYFSFAQDIGNGQLRQRIRDMMGIPTG